MDLAEALEFSLYARRLRAAWPEFFAAVGQWYEDFSQTTDREVQDLLAQHAQNLEARRSVNASKE